MAIGFTIKSSEVPVGVYKATFVGVERTTHAEYGSGLKFTFEIIEGKYQGKYVYRTTSDKPTPRNIAGKVLASLAGAMPSDGMAIDPDSFAGKEYQVVVGASESGFTRVTDILPTSEEQPRF